MKVKVYFIDDALYNEWVNDCERHGEQPQELYWDEIVFDTKRDYRSWLYYRDTYESNYGLCIKKVIYGKKNIKNVN